MYLLTSLIFANIFSLLTIINENPSALSLLVANLYSVLSVLGIVVLCDTPFGHLSSQEFAGLSNFKVIILFIKPPLT